MKDYMKIYQEWLSNPYFDEATKEELRAIEGNENEIKERFYMDLEFGTAGLRGIIGAGINRMNIYVVRRATQGLANYIIKQGAANKGVAIAYDSRHMSPEFAMEAAMTLAANGIKAYKFESLRPTPELSFAVRELGCVAGINITASHNPPEYNGYKVYWEDGAQFTPPHDKGVTEEVLAIEDLSTVKTTDEASATAAGLYQVIGQEIDDKYIAQVKAQVVNQKAIDEMQDQITIVYTPLHGTGNIPARRVMKEIGFTHVYVVPEQELPNGDFPTVSYPNPEAKEAFELGLKLAKEKDADLVLATDPDADRLGVYVKDTKSGEYIPLTGNMSGSRPILPRKSFVSIDSSADLGFSFITSLLCGSTPNAIAGRLSVKRLINSRCTGAKGTGSPARDAQRTARIAPKFPDRRNWIAYLIF
jgi:phosphoglucomutase